MEAKTRVSAAGFGRRAGALGAGLQAGLSGHHDLRALVEATADGILLKPVTAASIRRLRGILKRPPGEKPFAQEMADHKRAEKELENV